MHWKGCARNQLWKTELSQLTWDLPKWVEEYQEERYKRWSVSGQDLNPGLLKRKTVVIST
jgi:hypothetical protein